MYGLILESIACYLREVYGQEAWEEILYVANVSTERFGTSDIYSESTVNRIVTAAQEVINQPLEQMMESIGYKFCEFAATYDYDKIIRVLGRRFTDFMNGLDSLHEYLRFTYPKMKPPSFYCENESRTGLTLHYRSKRRGFMHYVKGQIKYISKTYYGIDVKLEVLDQSNEDNMEHTIFRLHYNNFDFGKKLINPNETEDFIRANMKITSDIFFDVFPFIIVFNRGMHIRNIGLALMRLMPRIIGRRISDEFVVLKPTIRFRWEDVVPLGTAQSWPAPVFSMDRTTGAAQCRAVPPSEICKIDAHKGPSVPQLRDCCVYCV
uniref:guanylate cyclase n=1 Tax=Romanomermis culicivorax TaxID=13658 RepID=A0A915KNZ7_ROMCU